MPPRIPRTRPRSDPEQASEKTQEQLHRPTADEIFEQVSRNGRHELERPVAALAVSGVAGGISMGLTALSVSVVMASLEPGRFSHFVAALFYPMGFIAVIAGRAQLFTENTLYPVALMLVERRHFWRTLRLWAVVLPSNVFGAYIYALLAVRTDALSGATVGAMAALGKKAAQGPADHIFWSAVVAGWIIALMAWLVSGSRSVLGSVVLIWLLTFIVGVGSLAHCIASSGEILAAVLQGQVTAARYFWWLLWAVLGNIVGGVFIVTMLEYGQVRAPDRR